MTTGSAFEDGDAPSDGTTMAEVLAGYAAAGFAGSFDTDDDRRWLRCLTCNATGPPDRFGMFSVRRFEGASDPDDEAAVVALACFNCTTRGTAVVMYGPQASPIENEILAAVQRQHDDLHMDVPAHSAPGETVGDTINGAG